MKNILSTLSKITFLASFTKTDKKLPVFEQAAITGSNIVYSTKKPFVFLNQESLRVIENIFENTIYVTDFIFLSCWSICLKIINELKKVYHGFKTNLHVYSLLHTIDLKCDFIQQRKQYAMRNREWIIKIQTILIKNNLIQASSIYS